MNSVKSRGRSTLLAFYITLSLSACTTSPQVIMQYNDPNATESPIQGPSMPETQLKLNTADVQCLSENIYFEARGEPNAGKYAIGHVVLNRIEHPAWPKTVCGVVKQKTGKICQFSWTCRKSKIVDSDAWNESKQIAIKLLKKDRKKLYDLTNGATYFHSVGLKLKWKNLQHTATIGNHIFFKARG